MFTFINDLERGLGTYLYGRRMYETMVYWETFGAAQDQLGRARSRGNRPARGDRSYDQ